MQFIREFITGFLIGVANLIPGVSGGTFALILGVYERIIRFLNRVNLASILRLIRLIFAWLTSGLKADKRVELAAYLKEQDYPFMAVIGFGAVFCILVMSSLMKYLLLQHFTYTYAFFFGLIVLSILIPYRMIKAPKPLLILPVIAGIFLTVFITASVNPYEKARNKSEMLEQQYVSQQATPSAGATEAQNASTRLAYIDKYTAGEYLYIFFCGVIAISAMVLPGVSGSLVLILMNQYFAVISAVANLKALLLDDLFFLASMMLGIVVGLLSFARVIDFAFKKFHDWTVCFLVGLIAGSLYSLWPFKQPEVLPTYYVKEGSGIEMVENYTVYSNVNVLPEEPQILLIASLIALAGMAVMAYFVRREPRQP